MTVAEMHTAVKVLFDKEDSLNYPNFKPEHIDLFLNLEQDRFVKHRYDGGNARNKGFEETQKRSDDLMNITTSAAIVPLATTSTNYPNGRFVALPALATDQYWFSITEQADVTHRNCGTTVASGKIAGGQLYIVLGNSIVYNGQTIVAGDSFTGTSITLAGVSGVLTTYTGLGLVYEAVRERVDVKPMQHDDYNKIIRDPFNKPVLDDKGYNQLRRLQFESRIEVIFPSTDLIFHTYILRYIRKPRRISLSSSIDCELADHTHQEIVDMAVSSMLENSESGRYQPNLNELSKLE